MHLLFVFLSIFVSVCVLLTWVGLGYISKDLNDSSALWMAFWISVVLLDGVWVLALIITASVQKGLTRRVKEWFVWGYCVGFGLLALVATVGGIWQSVVVGAAFGGGSTLPKFLQALYFQTPGLASLIKPFLEKLK